MSTPDTQVPNATSAPRVVAFGEIMLRLKSPGHERLFQSPSLEATFGGAEANVAIALAQYGLDAAFVTALPPNAVGDACVGELRRHGVDTRHVARADGRVGIYFLESGAAHRPSRVVYDREGSSIALAGPGRFDWDAILDGAAWFHVSGITPAVSESAARLCLESVEAARGKGLTVSLDYNYRANLWRYGKRAPEVMRDIMRHVHIGIAGREDCQKALGVDFPADASTGDVDVEHYHRLAAQVLDEFPNLDMQVITLRESHSATHNGWSACLLDRERFVVSRRYDLAYIVDRVGGGDSFSAGLVYGILTYGDAARALEFATAASCLKHTVPGDYNRVSVAEVEALMGGDGSGRVQR